MKRRTLLEAAVVAAPLAVFARRPARAAEFTFKLHHFLPAQAHAQRNMLEPWARRVEELSAGRVAIEIFPSMTLGGRPPELIQQVRDGVVDLVWTVNGYTPGQFPRTEVFELPFVYRNNPVAAALAMHDMFAEHLAADYAGVEVMFLHVHAGQAIHMRERPVRRPADLEGLRMRIPTRTGAWVLEALGAAPVAMPVPDVPQALQKGVIDGMLLPFEIIPPLRLQQLVKYLIELERGTRLGTTTFQVSMNRARWEGLPEDIRAAFRKASDRDWWAEVARRWWAAEQGGLEVATNAGVEHLVLDSEETALFERALEPVVQRWIEEVSGRGLDGEGLVATARERIARYADAQ